MTLELTDPQRAVAPHSLTTRDLVARLLDEESDRLQGEVDPGLFSQYYQPAKRLVSDLCLSDDFVDFLTLPAYALVK